MTHVLVCGVSTRAAAESAALAGFQVTTIDAYADLDQHPSVRAVSIAKDFGARYSAAAVAQASRTIDCDAVAYLSSFENHRRDVATLGATRALWGNPPAVLRRVRDPFAVAAELARRGFAVPINGVGSHLKRTSQRAWLLKPRASGGGRGVREWRGGDVPRSCYVQERIDGVPGSIVFAAAHGRVMPLGISRQIAGDAAFGAAGYQYCGSIMCSSDAQFGVDGSLAATARALAAAVTDAFGLAGVNGIDFIAHGDVPYPIEVNPRWSSSMELVERACGISVFAAHAEAFEARVSSLNDSRPHFDGAVGKAIVFARRAVTVGDTRPWLADPDVRDVPHPGERIPAGRPVCTVFAAAADTASCRDLLVERAARIYAHLDRWRQEAA